MTAVPLNLAFQCKWCNEDDLWLGHNCRRCGSKTGKCRAPKWERIRATVTSVDNPAYTTQMIFNGAASQCCGIGNPTNPNNPFPMNGTQWSDNPFRQTGVRCRYRYYTELNREWRKLCIQPTPPPIATLLYRRTGCGHWVYNLHWHYWSRLNGMQIYLTRLAAEECKYRVTLRVSGVHLLAHTFQFLNPLPPNNCAGQYFANGVYSGTKTIDIINPSTCQPDPCALLPNPDCAMPPFLPVAQPAVLNLPSQTPFDLYMTRDFDFLPDGVLLFDRSEHPNIASCGFYSTTLDPDIPSIACPAPNSVTYPPDTAWQTTLNNCEGCLLQFREDGGFETTEVESFGYTFSKAIWNKWNVQFTFV